MDFNDTADERAWRQEARAWLEANAPAHLRTDDGTIDDARKWQAMKYDAGLAKITWDPQFGGRNGSQMESIIFSQEEGEYRLPTDPFAVGLGMIAPTLEKYGTDAQKERYLTKLLRGDEIWCQLFSEPSAGSDVATLSTSAVRDGDEWVIAGQKVWTSGAHYSDFGEIICRTDGDAPKHRGITAFIVDMQAPGVTVKPLRQITGRSNFNEVFFDDVRVPADAVLGDVNQGWSVAIATLMNERLAIGSSGGAEGGGVSLERLIEIIRLRGLADDPVTRQRIADLHIKRRIKKFNGSRTLTTISQGGVPGPEGSIGKLFGSTYATELGDFAMAVLGPTGAADTDENYKYTNAFLLAPAFHLGGGTDEVMKNIIGERVLGLPGEPRVDKDLPWKDIPKSA